MTPAKLDFPMGRHIHRFRDDDVLIVRGPLFCLVGTVEGGIILKAPNPDYMTRI